MTHDDIYIPGFVRLQQPSQAGALCSPRVESSRWTVSDGGEWFKHEAERARAPDAAHGRHEDARSRRVSERTVIGAILDGRTPQQRWKAKLADWVICPVCEARWQRTKQQQQDDTRCCSTRCTGHLGNRGRIRRASREAIARYRTLIRERLDLHGAQARDVEVDDIVRLMLIARREGLVLGVQRGAPRRARTRSA